jgi:hypothetical protein
MGTVLMFHLESGERMDFPSLVIKLNNTDNKGEMKRDLHTTDRSTIKDLYQPRRIECSYESSLCTH